MTVGLALVYRSWPGLIAVGLLIPVLLMRIRDEEVLMRSEFGDEWQAYVSRSWRLLPRVY